MIRVASSVGTPKKTPKPRIELTNKKKFLKYFTDYRSFYDLITTRPYNSIPNFHEHLQTTIKIWQKLDLLMIKQSIESDEFLNDKQFYECYNGNSIRINMTLITSSFSLPTEVEKQSKFFAYLRFRFIQLINNGYFDKK